MIYKETEFYTKKQLRGLKYSKKGLQGYELYTLENKKGAFVFQTLDYENFECIAALEY